MPKVKPHKKTRKTCAKCLKSHSTSAHASHGLGSYAATHKKSKPKIKSAKKRKRKESYKMMNEHLLDFVFLYGELKRQYPLEIFLD